MGLFRHLTRILATGYILMFFSELVFWAHVRSEDSLQNWALTWLAYSLLGYVFLTLLVRFHVRSIWALFLAGAVFGWLAEGVIVQTAYESLPLSLSFTGLAWHALITVWVGWYALRRELCISLRSSLLLAAVSGLLYGFWAISWWVEPDGVLTPPADFARYAFLSTCLLILACWMTDRTQSTPWMPDRRVEILVGALFLLYFVFVAIPAAPIAGIILPVLLMIVYVALRRNRQVELQPSLIQAERGPISAGRYFSLLAMPAAAAAFYTASFALDLRWNSNWIVYLVTTPLGFILFGASLMKIWRMPGSHPGQNPV